MGSVTLVSMGNAAEPQEHATTDAGRPLLATGAALVAGSAFGGAAGLATGSLSLGAEIDQRLPFASLRFSGAALAVVVGLPFSALSALAWRGDRRAGPASVGAGATLMAWIVVQLAFIRRVSFLHPLFFVIGAVFVAAGRRPHP